MDNSAMQAQYDALAALLAESRHLNPYQVVALLTLKHAALARGGLPNDQRLINTLTGATTPDLQAQVADVLTAHMVLAGDVYLLPGQGVTLCNVTPLHNRYMTVTPSECATEHEHPASGAMTGAERVRLSRARKRRDVTMCNADVTLCNVTCNVTSLQNVTEPPGAAEILEQGVTLCNVTPLHVTLHDRYTVTPPLQGGTMPPAITLDVAPSRVLDNIINNNIIYNNNLDKLTGKGGVGGKPIPANPPPEQQPDHPPAKPPRAKPKPKVALDSQQFADFWQAYPRKVGKHAAQLAYAKAIAAGDCPIALLTAAQAYARERDGEQPAYTMHAARWLRDKRYLDEPQVKKNETNQQFIAKNYKPGDELKPGTDAWIERTRQQHAARVAAAELEEDMERQGQCASL
jgi:hypothetical protein